MLSDGAKMRNPSGPGELQILGQIRRRASRIPADGLTLGIGDDCALIRPRRREDLAVTTDLSVAGRHFRLEWHPAETVGHRTLARGLSDLAAMGARPLAAFLSLGLPRELTRPGRGRGRTSWLDGFLDGFLELARASKAPLAGGDLAESPIAAADIVLLGAVARGRALLRSGARPGDAIYVTGTLGGAAAGYARLARIAERGGSRRARRLRVPERPASELARHLYPQPRLAQGQWLIRHRVATAAIDISDGLSTDLAHICEESGVAAEIDAEALPIHPGASLDQAMNGGEDYELLFTARESARMPRVVAGVPVTAIGRILRRRKGGSQVTLLTARGPQALKARGWQHFA